MAHFFSTEVLEGEISNTKRNMTQGWIRIRGRDEPVHFELTGNPDADLQGVRILFSTPMSSPINERDDDDNAPKITPRQFGAVGSITACRMVWTVQASMLELIEPTSDSPPETPELKQCLHLEWFGNDGHVVVQVTEPLIEVIVEETDDDNFIPESDQAMSYEVSADFEYDPDLEMPDPDLRELILDDPIPSQSSSGAKLSPDELGSKPLASQSDESDIEEQLAADLVFMKGMLKNGGEMVLAELIGKTPGWSQVTESQADVLVRNLAARLAQYHVVYEICNHCTMLEAYRILVEEVARDCRMDPNLRKSGWVLHVGTHASCTECAVELASDDDEFTEDALDD